MKALVLGRGKSAMAAAAELRSRGYDVDFADGFDQVVASPGIPVKSELQLGCETLRSRGVRMLAVTGSKGKSSVVKLVADAIVGAGMRAIPCGNYGLPVCEVGDCDWAVVEVSSFQLETTVLPPDAFEAAAILNLQEDHLDRHGSVEVYHSLKRRLLGFSRRGFTADDIATETDDFARLASGSYFDNDILRGNGAMAIALMRVAGLDDGTIGAAFRNFTPLPHRMECVGAFGGVRCVDDSKATSLAALAAALAMVGGNVRLIAGGLPKGDDPSAVVPHLTRWAKKVYLIGQSAESFRSAWHSYVDCEVCGTLDRAVEAAMRDAVSGETVLLSPGTASFDQFNGFGERGDAFARLVKKEGQKKT